MSASALALSQEDRVWIVWKCRNAASCSVNVLLCGASENEAFNAERLTGDHLLVRAGAWVGTPCSLARFAQMLVVSRA